MDVLSFSVVIVYGISLLFIFMFSLGQLHLVYCYKKRLRRQQQPAEALPADLPHVTIQLPVFNELYVVERLIEAVVGLDYPKELLEVQVLDDSTDETVDILRKKINEYQKLGFDILHVIRPDRKGFKAGALQFGLDQCKGEFVAVFDADFIPGKDFLKESLPFFSNKKVGMVQTRWGHLNKDYSLLTKLQAFGLDAHFTVEQGGRSEAGSFINFNGTAGIWRKATIYDAGGWSADTLTEDLDLSYRAQLKGWVFEYREDVESPAELPILMPAIKSQQYRWNKGAAETARKNLGKVLRSKINWSSKIHAVFHLLNSSVFVSLFVASLLSVPMLYIKEAHPGLNVLFNLGSLFLLGFFSISYFYWVASKRVVKKGAGKYFITTFPLFLIVSMGLSLHNGMAVLEGLMGKKTPFIRTPKFNVKDRSQSWKKNKYIHPKLSLASLVEGVLSLYFMFGIYSGIVLLDWGLMVFHVMLWLGFGMVFYYSLKPMAHAK